MTLAAAALFVNACDTRDGAAPIATSGPSRTTSSTPAPSTTVAPTTTTQPTTTLPPVTTTLLPVTTTLLPVTTAPPTTPPPAPRYAFPFTGHHVSWPSSHHDYPAVDVFGCGATVVSPTNGTVVQVRTEDLWERRVNSGSTRGGKYVAVLGVDGVRYYFAHLADVAVVVGQHVEPGDVLGPMGQTGDARLSVCHTHVGISWPCPGTEWRVRRGKVWPQQYLAAWQRGEQTSPADEVASEQAAQPDACTAAMAEPDAANS